MALAIAKVKRFEGSDAKICRARKGLPMNSIDTRKASDSIAEATVSLFDAVDMLFMGNSALQN